MSPARTSQGGADHHLKIPFRLPEVLTASRTPRSELVSAEVMRCYPSMPDEASWENHPILCAERRAYLARIDRSAYAAEVVRARAVPRPPRHYV